MGNFRIDVVLQDIDDPFISWWTGKNESILEHRDEMVFPISDLQSIQSFVFLFRDMIDTSIYVDVFSEKVQDNGNDDSAIQMIGKHEQRHEYGKIRLGKAKYTNQDTRGKEKDIDKWTQYDEYWQCPVFHKAIIPSPGGFLF